MTNEFSTKKDGHVFVIAEAGSNWKKGSLDEDLKQARELIKVASDAGADAVKFQTYKAETVYVHDAGKSDYLKGQGVHEDINKIFDHLSMPYEMIPELSEYCKKEGILFMSTPFSVPDAKEINPYVGIHKVASFEINHNRLLQYLASTQKPLIVSTGASTYEDIDFAMNLVNKAKVSLLQCTSKYPAPLESLNLSVIPKLQKKYNVPVGLSDHSTDPIIAPLVAVGYGASIIEKHFTLDRSLPGPDHPFALEPHDLKRMIEYIRNAENTRGTGEKTILDEERELWQFAKRTIQATKDIAEGEILREGYNFDVLRPGTRTRGIDAKFLDMVEGKKSKSAVRKGEGIVDFE